MHEQEVRIQSGEIELIGTLCVPEREGEFPAVLMVHGSGPLDRDENMKGQQLNIFNAIAHAMAACGIASLRYDKRGCGSSRGDFMKAGHSDLIQDAMRCLDTMAKLDCVSGNDLYILGHSEGCIIAPQVALHRPSVAGLILLCPFVEHIESVMLRQAAQLEKEMDSLPGIPGFLYRVLFAIIGRPRASQRRLIQKVRESDYPIVRTGLTRFPAKWLREMLELDAESIFASTCTPMMLIGGEKDLQCNPRDVFRIAEVAQSQSETLLIENMTHLLRVDEGPATILGSARLSSQAVEPVVIEKTIQWIRLISSANNQLHASSRAGA